MKKIGILGGSFSPPHNSHKALVDFCIKYKIVDEVWVIPTCNHTQKNITESFKHRLQMCKIMFEGWFKKVKVLDIDYYNKSGTTFDLMSMLNSKFNKPFEQESFQFSLIIGKDCADNIKTWYKWEDLTNIYSFIIFERGDYVNLRGPETWYYDKKHTIFITKDVYWNSTYVRKLCYKQFYEIASHITSKKVVDYIVKNDLYLINIEGILQDGN